MTLNTGSLNQLYGNTQGEKVDYTEVCKNIEQVVCKLGFVNKHLEGKKFLVGESLTIADLYFVGLFERFFRFAISKDQREKLCHLTAYMTERVNSETFRKYMRPLSFGDDEFPHFKVDLAEEKRAIEEFKRQ